MNKPVLPISSLSLKLPLADRSIETYRLAASRTFPSKLQGRLNRVAFSAAHVVADPLAKVDGVKVSLLDKRREIDMRRRLNRNVKMYTGDDFNYAELIAGDEHGFSHALLGIFDAIAPAASCAASRRDAGFFRRSPLAVAQHRDRPQAGRSCANHRGLRAAWHPRHRSLAR